MTDQPTAEELVARHLAAEAFVEDAADDAWWNSRLPKFREDFRKSARTVISLVDAARQASGQQPDPAQHVHKLGKADDDGLMDDWDNCRDPECPGPTPAAGLPDTQPANNRAAVLREAADAVEARLQKQTGRDAQHDYVIMRLNHERRTLAAVYRRIADEETSR